MNYYLVTYDKDDVDPVSEIVYCRYEKEAKKIVARELDIKPKLLNAELKQLYSLESINKVNAIREKLEKYSFPHKIIKKLLNHITRLKEYIEVPEVNKIGDPVYPIISISYTYDNIKYNVGFELDYSGNSKCWIWSDYFECEDENNLHLIFRKTICRYLNVHYT